MKISNYKSLIIILSFHLLNLSCAEQTPPLKPGQPAPDFTLPNVDGQIIQLSNLSGEKILLHFWADWCTECRAEFPKLQNYHLLQKDEDLKIICINVGQTNEHIQSFVDNYQLTFPMLMDKDMIVSKIYNIKGLPTSVLINSDFTINKTHIGWLDEKLIVQMQENMK